MNSMKRDTLRTVDDVIDAFGGNTVVADWLGIGTSAVCNWRERQSIPPGWHLRFYLEAEARGLRIDLNLFGMEGISKARPPRGNLRVVTPRSVIA